MFGHVIVEQQGEAFGETAATFPGAYKGDGFVFLMATLVRVSLAGFTAAVQVVVGVACSVRQVSQGTLVYVCMFMPSCCFHVHVHALCNVFMCMFM